MPGEETDKTPATLAPGTSQLFVGVPGGRMYVRIWKAGGADAAAPVILLHDSLGCVGMWRDFPGALAVKLGRTVIAYDRLGFGRSSARAGLPSIDFIAEEAEIYFPAVREALGLKRFVLFGHSVGGGMAVMCAGRFTDECQGLITEAAQAFVEERTRQGILHARAAFQDARVLAKLEKYHGGKAAWVLRAWTDVWLSPAFASWTLAPALPRVRSQLLAIHGEKDEYGTIASPQMICDLTGGAARKLIIPGCGHVPHREQQDMVLDAVAGFLGGTEA